MTKQVMPRMSCRQTQSKSLHSILQEAAGVLLVSARNRPSGKMAENGASVNIHRQRQRLRQRFNILLLRPVLYPSCLQRAVFLQHALLFLVKFIYPHGQAIPPAIEADESHIVGEKELFQPAVGCFKLHLMIYERASSKTPI